MYVKKFNKILALATASRGALRSEKYSIVKKYFPECSPRFLLTSHAMFEILLALKIERKLSAYRINEITRETTSINLRIFTGFKILDQHKDEQTKVKYYTLTPLSAKMIDDLLMMYDERINTYLKLNAKDKRTKPAKLLANSKNKAKK